MPGVERLSVDLAVKAAEEAAELGIPGHRALSLYRPCAPRRAGERSAQSRQSRLPRGARHQEDVPEIGIICDVALDPYTSHGHDGLLVDGEIDNDRTIEVLIRQALVQAEAGCDILAPSDMMDGRIGAIRAALEANGFINDADSQLCREIRVGLLRAVPRRGRLGRAGCAATSCSYQMDPANGDEALREVALDIAEGADMVMVKPGLAYLDIVRRVKDAFRRADLRLSDLGRVFDDHGRCRARLARPRPRDHGKPDRLQARRRRRRAHLFRARRGTAAEGSAR